MPKSLKCADLKPYRITKWARGHSNWGDTTEADAIKYVQQVFAWAERQGIIGRNPVKHVDKPTRRRRDVFYDADKYQQILSHTDRAFGDFLKFAWYTGGRPQEVRTLESRQITRTGNSASVEFEIRKSKGQTDRRKIMLCDEALQIFDRYAAKNKAGPIFRNSQGNPFTKDSIGQRLRRIRDKVGFQVILYGARHSYATNAIYGGVDPITLAHLMGHKDLSMVANVYSHVDANRDHLAKSAQRAAEPLTEGPAKDVAQCEDAA